MNKYFKLFEQYNKTYQEVEFICHNTETGSTTTSDNQIGLYNELKNIEGLLPYMQDWSNEDYVQKSLAVIILDESITIDSIVDIASKWSIEMDMVNDVPEWKVDEILKGSLDNLVIEENEETIVDYSKMHKAFKEKYPSINYGGCAVFAKAFHNVTDYPIVMLFDTDLTDEDPPIHVVVKIGDDAYIDGESIRTEEEIRNYYDDGETGELDFVEDEPRYNLFDTYYEELGEGLFSHDHKHEYENILDLIKSTIR